MGTLQMTARRPVYRSQSGQQFGHRGGRLIFAMCGSDAAAGRWPLALTNNLFPVSTMLETNVPTSCSHSPSGGKRKKSSRRCRKNDCPAPRQEQCGSFGEILSIRSNSRAMHSPIRAPSEAELSPSRRPCSFTAHRPTRSTFIPAPSAFHRPM
jgi:hypothetical protein